MPTVFDTGYVWLFDSRRTQFFLQSAMQQLAPSTLGTACAHDAPPRANTIVQIHVLTVVLIDLHKLGDQLKHNLRDWSVHG